MTQGKQPEDAGDLAPFHEAVFEDPACGILLLDAAGWVRRCNAAASGLAVLPPHLIEGWPAFMLVASADRERFRAWMSAAPPVAGVPAQTAAMQLRLQASGLPVSLSLTSVTGAEGNLVGYVLRLSPCRLAAEPLHPPAPVQRLQALGQLTAGIAHDFSNLVCAMLGAVDTLEAGGGDAAGPQGRAALADLRAAAGRSRALVRRLVEYGRPDLPEARPLAVDAAVDDLATLLRQILPATVKLELDLGAPGASVFADPTRFDQVMLNLAINARDAMPQGGRLRMRSRARTLEAPRPGVAGPIPAGSYVVAEVADTGQGIPPAILPRIFEPFFTTRLDSGGSGLGLATVRDIVAEAGGALEVLSVVGQGTRMRVYLPLLARDDAGRPGAANALPATARAARRGTILLVEDEPAVRRLAEQALTRAGWSVAAAESGAAALALLPALRTRAARPTVVVSDILLGDMAGTALAAAVRTALDAPALPVLLTSGLNDRPVRDAVGALGPAAAFLAKPYDLAQLTAAIDRIAHTPADTLPARATINATVDEQISNLESAAPVEPIAGVGVNVTDSNGVG